MTAISKGAQTNGLRYKIIETDIGPLISESRVSVFDVLEARDAGDSPYEIGLTFNLSPLQVETALAYIAQHRAELEPQLAQIKRQLVEREAFYRRQAAEFDAYVANLPMTSQRAALRVLRERSALQYESTVDADSP
jgi:uncharacterized protein (DUF433 family)